MHCDTLGAVLLQDPERRDLYHCPAAMLDLARMRQAGQTAQFFAVFLPPAGTFAEYGIPDMSDEEYIETLRQILLQNVQRHGDILAMAYNADDVYRNRAAGRMSAILTMEDGRAVQGKLENLERFYRQGFRAIALTWNGANCFGAPNSADPAVMAAGLTPFGKEAVAYMQELGMLVDVSHLSEGGFYDVAAVCKKPFIASHSNSRGALCAHQRGLTDDQVRTLANAGGVTGLNFCPYFLHPDGTGNTSTAALIARHARHLADVGGVECVGLGSDFDGITGELEIGDSTKVPLLADALQKEGFTAADIEKIFYQNVLRVLRDAMH